MPRPYDPRTNDPTLASSCGHQPSRNSTAGSTPWRAWRLVRLCSAAGRSTGCVAMPQPDYRRGGLWQASGTSEKEAVVRLATFNLMSGRSLADGLVDEGRLYRAIAELDADVLALQEVDRDQPRSNGLDLTAVAEAATGAVASRFAATMLGLPEQWRPARDDGVDVGPASRYGVALVSS